MPIISRFFGISVRMNYNDHNPPHFHVNYGSQEAIVAISPLQVIQGWLSPRVLGMVMEWAAIHQAELMADWNLARAQAPLEPISPLE